MAVEPTELDELDQLAQQSSNSDNSDNSDDELEIVLTAPSGSSSVQRPGLSASGSVATAPPAAAAASAAPETSVGLLKPTPKQAVGMPIPRQDSTAAPTTQQNNAGSRPAIDIDAMGQLDGKDIIDVDLEDFEDKPWRKPGADISDYFNYGFNETTWKAYCNKQKMMREELDAQKRLRPMDMSKDVDFGFDMQAFAAQQRMLGSNPMQNPAFPMAKFQRTQGDNATWFEPEDHAASSSGGLVLGKRAREDDDLGSFPGDPM
eukprot:jgi/Hompol1/3803/HPOL_003356-RA